MEAARMGGRLLPRIKAPVNTNAVDVVLPTTHSLYVSACLRGKKLTKMQFMLRPLAVTRIQVTGNIKTGHKIRQTCCHHTHHVRIPFKMCFK